jgi:DNA-binding transcriptional ArsR family regulator
MARAATTLDPFNAIAEPKRRRVLDVLAGGELQVNGIVKTLGWPQPVGLVDVRREGRRQMYKLNAENLRPIHDWVKTYERFWSHQLQRIKVVAEAKAKIPNSETSNNRSDSNG